MVKTETDRRRELATVRDTFESIWVAIVLAFVLRAFMIEAFVIPTGSMAPRLMGQHWDLRCPTCGYEYARGVDKDIVAARGSDHWEVPRGAHCPNCGAPYSKPGWEFFNSGDRVLVLKYLYHFNEPQPWDVVVFKNPQDNRQNYIKRLIGLPGETIEIVHGDIFVGADPNEPLEVRRKPKRAQDAMWQVVFDNDYRPDPKWILDSNMPRWIPVDGVAEGGGGRRFHFRGGAGVGELRFTSDHSDRAEREKRTRRKFLPRYGYNRPDAESGNIDGDRDICTDLKLSLVLVPKGSKSVVVLETTAFEMRFRAELHTDGRAFLRSQPLNPLDPGKWESWGAKAIRPLEEGKGHEVALTYVDFFVTLWLDGKPVLQRNDERSPSNYEWLKERMEQVPRRPIPTPQLRIALTGEPCDLWHVKIMRDVYYTTGKLQKMSPPADVDWRGPRGDYAREIDMAHRNEGEHTLSPDDRRYRKVDLPSPGWGTTGRQITLARKRKGQRDDLDEFFCLGDNSPQSLDGRSWYLAGPTLRLYDEDGNFQYQLGTVPRYSLIGKALFVYWPAGFRFPGLPGLPGFPIIPNVGRMRLIR